MTIAMPGVRPAVPHFSSGPCAKRPGWSLQGLTDAALGRSHRTKIGKAKLKRAIDLTREVLQVPAGHRIAIVPASDTGAIASAASSTVPVSYGAMSKYDPEEPAGKPCCSRTCSGAVIR